MDKGKGSKRYIIYKKGTDTQTETETETSSQDTQKYRFESIVNTNYKKPKGGTVQDNLSTPEIKAKLVGYKSLKTKESKKYLLTLTPFKVWLKYYNPKTKQFRTGGLLFKVDPELKYIMLVNTSSNLTWSVQLDDHIIFVPDPNKTEKKEQETKERDQERKEQEIKDKLYKLYKSGKLSKNK